MLQRSSQSSNSSQEATPLIPSPLPPGDTFNDLSLALGRLQALDGKMETLRNLYLGELLKEEDGDSIAPWQV